jgi:DNA-binding NtrC family response regulator
MPARSDRDSEGIEGGGETPQEPLIGRELELDVLRRHIAGVAETRRGHVVLVLGESGVGNHASPLRREPRHVGVG